MYCGSRGEDRAVADDFARYISTVITMPIINFIWSIMRCLNNTAVCRTMATVAAFVFGYTTVCNAQPNIPVDKSTSDVAGTTQKISINGVIFNVPDQFSLYSWEILPGDVSYERMPVASFTDSGGKTHFYEVVYIPSGNLNWFQAGYLAEQAGGYLVSLTSEEENQFVFNLVNNEKYFWKFPKYDGDPGRKNHYEISIGPFVGGYQQEGAAEPAGGWCWLSGESWEYTNWAVNLDDGIVDRDPRNNSQPNDSGNSQHGQRVMGFGEMNVPVPTWGDYMDDVGTYGVERSPGRSYGFIIEYSSVPKI